MYTFKDLLLVLSQLLCLMFSAEESGSVSVERDEDGEEAEKRGYRDDIDDAVGNDAWSSVTSHNGASRQAPTATHLGLSSSDFLAQVLIDQLGFNASLSDECVFPSIHFPLPASSGCSHFPPLDQG